MCSLFQVSSFRSCNNPGKISFQPWQSPYVFLKVIWEDPEFSWELTGNHFFFTSGTIRILRQLYRSSTEDRKGSYVILLWILSGSWWLPYYTFLPGFRCIVNRILIQIECEATRRQKRILFPILEGSWELPYYTLLPGICRSLRKKEPVLAGSFPYPLLNLKGNHTDLH